MILYTTETATVYNASPQDSNKGNKKTSRPPIAGEYNGYLSKKTARTVTRRIGNLLEIAEAGGRLVTFVTLTLPSIQKHSDEYIRRFLFNDFIRILKEKYSVVNYLWKAEAQNNNNIHFHLLCDNYLENRRNGLEPGEINKVWNHILSRYGYIEPYRSKMLSKYMAGEIEPEKIDYYLYNDFRQPPTTQVKKLEKRERPESYINKYIGKAEPGKRLITGKIVGCSDSLKAVDNFKSFEKNIEDYIALDRMARECPDQCTRIAVVMEEPAREVLPAIDSENLFNNPNPEEKQYYKEKWNKDRGINSDEEKTSESGETKKRNWEPAVIRKNFTELPTDTILVIKYYYTAKLWKKYAPKSHLINRKIYFESIANLHYFGLCIEESGAPVS